MMNQISFSARDGFKSSKEAKQARDIKYRTLKAEGRNIVRFTLRNQIWKTMTDEGIADIYFVQIN